MDGDIHVSPIDDLLPHDCTSPNCMCDPKVIVEGGKLVYIHNSYDGREDDEATLDIPYSV